MNLEFYCSFKKYWIIVLDLCIPTNFIVISMKIYLLSVNKGILYEISTTEDLDTTTKDTQKKSKRKGRNKQEIAAVCQAEPEPVKTPIDLMKVWHLI